MNIGSLPNEILVNVFGRFDPKTLARCSQVCKRWKLASQNQTLWKKFYKEEYGKSPQTEKLNYKALCTQRYEILNKIRHCEHKKYKISITLWPLGILGLNGRLLILGKRVFFTDYGKIFTSKVKKSNFKNSTLFFGSKIKKNKISYQSLSEQSKQMYKNGNSISSRKFHSYNCILEKSSECTFLSRGIIQRNQEASFAVWDINKGSCVFAEKNSINGLIQIIKDRVIYNNHDKGMICCDMKTKKVMFTLPGLSSFVSHQTSYGNFVAATCRDKTIHVYDLKKREKILFLKDVEVRDLSLTVDKLIYQTRSKIYIHDLITLTPICQIRIPPIESRSFCYNQKIVIHVSKKHPNKLLIRDLREGRIIQKLRGSVDSITNFKMTDNRVVAISSKNKVVWIWDINSGQLKTSFGVTHGKCIKSFQIENNILHLNISNNKEYNQFWNLTNCRLISEEEFGKNTHSRFVWSHYEDGILTYLYTYIKFRKGLEYCRYGVKRFKYFNG